MFSLVFLVTVTYASSSQKCLWTNSDSFCDPNSDNDQCVSFGGMSMNTPVYCDSQTNKCKCSYPYNENTCLPDLHGCSMCGYTDGISGIGNSLNLTSDSVGIQFACYQQNNTIISNNIEIRMISVYESIEGNHGSIKVTLYACDYEYKYSLDHEIILILSSYESVNWELQLDNSLLSISNNVSIDYLYVNGYYNQTVAILDDNLYIENIIINSGGIDYGYGNDQGGGATAYAIENIKTTFEVAPYSFLGTYRTNSIELCIGTSDKSDIGSIKNLQPYYMWLIRSFMILEAFLICTICIFICFRCSKQKESNSKEQLDQDEHLITQV